MITRALTADECDVVVKGVIGDEARGGYLTPAGTFQLYRASDAPLADADLRALAVTPGRSSPTCVPPGSGRRIGVDRDEDGHLVATSWTPAATRRMRPALPSRRPRFAPAPSACATTTARR